MTIIIPDPITKPYCNTGAKVTTPVGSSTTVANQETGFPPLQATPLNAGGIPVDIEQFNGVLNLYSHQVQALVSGAKFTFNQAVSDENGGYPLGIILYCESNNSYQKSLVVNNTANFVTTPSYIDDGINWRSVQSIHNLTTYNINQGGQTANFGGDIIANTGVIFATNGNITSGLSLIATVDVISTNGDIKALTGVVKANSGITTNTGDIKALTGDVYGDSIIASLNSVVKNGGKLALFNVAETFATTFKSYPTATQQDYILPPSLPTTSGQPLTSDTSGNMSWVYAGKIIGSNGIPSDTGCLGEVFTATEIITSFVGTQNLSKLMNLPIGNFLVSANVQFTILAPSGFYSLLCGIGLSSTSTLGLIPGRNAFQITNPTAAIPNSTLTGDQRSIPFYYINVTSPIDLYLIGSSTNTINNLSCLLSAHRIG